MRILFVTMAMSSHLFPIVPVAWACRAAGHDVRVAGQPTMVGPISASGLTPVAVGRDYDFMQVSHDLLQEVRRKVRQGTGRPLQPGDVPGLPAELRRQVETLRFGPHAEMADAMAADLIDFCRSWHPDLIVADQFLYAAPLAARVTGTPFVRYMMGPDFLRHMGYPGLGAAGAGDARSQWPEVLLALFDRFGVPAEEDFACRVLDSCPASLQFPGMRNRVPYRHVPYNGTWAAPVPDWLLDPAGRPRICITWGTGTTRIIGQDGFLVPGILRALAEVDVDIVVAVSDNDRELLGEVPAGVKVVAQMPLHLLLPSCDVIVNQGGAGSILAAAACGLPQVIVPQAMDQVFNAGRMAAVGAGVAVPADQAATAPGSFDPDAVKAAVLAALPDSCSFLAAARKLQEEIQALPAPTMMVGVLEEAAAEL
jgi:UDP:flavonoid glycosyltransferase YjiC (YdhE family)